MHEEDLLDTIPNEKAREKFERLWHSIRELHKMAKAIKIELNPQELGRFGNEGRFLHEDFSVIFHKCIKF